MKYDPRFHQRRSIRLPEYDYSGPGAYFVTLVTRGRECLFGEIVNAQMGLNDAGHVVRDVWNSLPARYPQITLGVGVVMPNHFHGIVIINGPPPVGAIHELPQREERRIRHRRMTLPLVVGYFKMNSAKRINEILDSPGVPLWQRNYYEHIIRDDRALNRIRNYIDANPANWKNDEENR